MSVLFISLLPLSFTLGQEKKNEQKIKIIIADKSGTKVVIDTTYAGVDNVDSIILKSGNMIYIGKEDSEPDNRQGTRVKVIAHADKDVTQYVIAKDGITVTIEGNDEQKVKELAEEIEKKLDIDKGESETAVKETEKKIVKKN